MFVCFLFLLLKKRLAYQLAYISQRSLSLSSVAVLFLQHLLVFQEPLNPKNSSSFPLYHILSFHTSLLVKQALTNLLLSHKIILCPVPSRQLPLTSLPSLASSQIRFHGSPFCFRSV